MFSGVFTITFGASICHLSSLLVSARVLDDFRGISCFVMFNVTRAVLETLPNHAQLVACLSQRAAVKSRHTQQHFVLWLRRLHDLANPWKRFKSLVIFWNQCFTEFWSHPFLCRRAWCFASARPCFPFDADPSWNIVAQIEKWSQVLWLSFNPLLSARTRGLCVLVFPLSRGWGVCAHIPHHVPSQPGSGPLTSLFAFLVLRVSLILRIKNMSHRIWHQRYSASITSVSQRNWYFHNLLGKDTRVPTKFLSWEDPARWNSAIHCERCNTSW